MKFVLYTGYTKYS